MAAQTRQFTPEAPVEIEVGGSRRQDQRFVADHRHQRRDQQIESLKEKDGRRRHRAAGGRRNQLLRLEIAEQLELAADLELEA